MPVAERTVNTLQILEGFGCVHRREMPPNSMGAAYSMKTITTKTAGEFLGRILLGVPPSPLPPALFPQSADSRLGRLRLSKPKVRRTLAPPLSPPTHPPLLPKLQLQSTHQATDRLTCGINLSRRNRASSSRVEIQDSLRRFIYENIVTTSPELLTCQALLLLHLVSATSSPTPVRGRRQCSL